MLLQLKDERRRRARWIHQTDAGFILLKIIDQLLLRAAAELKKQLDLFFIEKKEILTIFKGLKIQISGWYLGLNISRVSTG